MSTPITALAKRSHTLPAHVVADRVVQSLLEAEKALSFAVGVDQVKLVMNVAAAQEVFAKRQHLGDVVIGFAHALWFHALAKLADTLAAMPKAGPQHSTGGGSKGSTRVPLPNAPPTLAELGIDKKTSAVAQQLAGLDAKTREAIAQRETTLTEARREIHKQQKAEKKAAVPLLPAGSDRYRLIVGHLATADVADASVDWVITDPPYEQSALPLYASLSAFAARVLKPGGSLLCMAGQSYLPEVLTALSSQMTYHWTVAYLTPGGQAAQIWDRKVNTFWKPVVWLTKGKYTGDWVGDVCRSSVNDNDKEHHRWGQSESGMADLVERFTDPGQTICDPFCGGGTTGVVAVQMHRLFIGIDVDADAIAKTLERLFALEISA